MIKTITINNKVYKMPEFNYGDIRKLEEAGCSLLNFSDIKNHMFGALSAFVAITAGVDNDRADFLIGQHVEGGGDIGELFTQFITALQDSHFFNQMVEKMGDRMNPEKVESPKRTKRSTEE